MLTQTTESAIRVLVHLGLHKEQQPMPMQTLASRLNISPSYLVKIVGSLKKAGIIETVRGAQGGVSLVASPDRVNLLEIVEASQGRVLGDYCHGITSESELCAYHHAMLNLHGAIVSALSGQTLADLLERPTGPGSDGTCKMLGVVDHGR